MGKIVYFQLKLYGWIQDCRQKFKVVICSILSYCLPIDMNDNLYIDVKDWVNTYTDVTSPIVMWAYAY